jgi:tetratricopeptide (TPR) repeat protein
LHTNRLDLAEAQLQKVATLDSKFPATYASLGILKLRQGNKDEALKYLTQAVEADSQNHLAHYYCAHLLQQLSEDAGSQDRHLRLELMRNHIEKSIELNPRFTQAYDMLGYVALMTRERLAEAESAVTKAIEYSPGRLELRLRLAELMLSNNHIPSAQAILTSLKNSAAEDIIRYRAERMLDDIKNRQQVENDLRAYQDRRREIDEAAERAAAQLGPKDDEPPKLAHKDTEAPKQTDTDVVETAKPQMRAPEGLRIEGSLTQVDCASGLTLRIRVGATTVELHTDTPAQVEFVSYVATIKDTFSCGPTKPEVVVAVIYKRGADRRFLGEPLRIEFVKPN